MMFFWCLASDEWAQDQEAHDKVRPALKVMVMALKSNGHDVRVAVMVLESKGHGVRE
jgi:hypothetical protein